MAMPVPTACEDQLTEITVERDQYPILAPGTFDRSSVGVAGALARNGRDVVTRRRQRVDARQRHVLVCEEAHGACLPGKLGGLSI